MTILCENISENKDNNKQLEKEPLVDDSSSEEDEQHNELRTTEEERRGTIPGSTVATAMALACSRATANPTVERGPPKKTSKRKNKEPKSVATQVGLRNQ